MTLLQDQNTSKKHSGIQDMLDKMLALKEDINSGEEIIKQSYIWLPTKDNKMDPQISFEVISAENAHEEMKFYMDLLEYRILEQIIEESPDLKNTPQSLTILLNNKFRSLVAENNLEQFIKPTISR